MSFNFDLASLSAQVLSAVGQDSDGDSGSDSDEDEQQQQQKPKQQPIGEGSAAPDAGAGSTEATPSGGGSNSDDSREGSLPSMDLIASLISKEEQRSAALTTPTRPAPAPIEEYDPILESLAASLASTPVAPRALSPPQGSNNAPLRDDASTSHSAPRPSASTLFPPRTYSTELPQFTATPTAPQSKWTTDKQKGQAQTTVQQPSSQVKRPPQLQLQQGQQQGQAGRMLPPAAPNPRPQQQPMQPRVIQQPRKTYVTKPRPPPRKAQPRPSLPVHHATGSGVNAKSGSAMSLDELARGNNAPLPTYPWWMIIRAAIMGSPYGMLTKPEICGVIARKWPALKSKGDQFPGAVAHNLSVKDCFRRCHVEGEGATSFYIVDTDLDGGKGRPAKSGNPTSRPPTSTNYQSQCSSLNKCGARSFDDNRSIFPCDRSSPKRSDRHNSPLYPPTPRAPGQVSQDAVQQAMNGVLFQLTGQKLEPESRASGPNLIGRIRPAEGSESEEDDDDDDDDDSEEDEEEEEEEEQPEDPETIRKRAEASGKRVGSSLSAIAGNSGGAGLGSSLAAIMGPGPRPVSRWEAAAAAAKEKEAKEKKDKKEREAREKELAAELEKKRKAAMAAAAIFTTTPAKPTSTPNAAPTLVPKSVPTPLPAPRPVPVRPANSAPANSASAPALVPTPVPKLTLPIVPSTNTTSDASLQDQIAAAMANASAALTLGVDSDDDSDSSDEEIAPKIPSVTPTTQAVSEPPKTEAQPVLNLELGMGLGGLDFAAMMKEVEEELSSDEASDEEMEDGEASTKPAEVDAPSADPSNAPVATKKRSASDAGLEAYLQALINGAESAPLPGTIPAADPAKEDDDEEGGDDDDGDEDETPDQPAFSFDLDGAIAQALALKAKAEQQRRLNQPPQASNGSNAGRPPAATSTAVGGIIKKVPVWSPNAPSPAPKVVKAPGDESASVVYERPRATYPELAKEAITSVPHGRLTAAEIFQIVEGKYPYFRDAPESWKATMRNVLTSHSCFVKVPRPPDAPGRGDYWATIDIPIWKRRRTTAKAKKEEQRELLQQVEQTMTNQHSPPPPAQPSAQITTQLVPSQKPPAQPPPQLQQQQPAASVQPSISTTPSSQSTSIPVVQPAPPQVEPRLAQEISTKQEES